MKALLEKEQLSDRYGCVMFGGHDRNLPGKSTGWDWGEEEKQLV